MYKTLLKHVGESLLRTKENNADQLMDIEYRTSNAGEGLKDLFSKTFKFGYLMNTQQRVHPLQNETLIVYVIGGITTYEYKMMRELFKHESHNVLIGSSHFHNHNKLLSQLLG